MLKELQKYRIVFYLSLIILSCSCGLDLSSQYGITEISVSGKQLYFRREIRGLNYDKIILSPNKNHCAEYNADSDYRFSSLDDIVYYKIDGDVLYLVASNIVLPKNFPTKVILDKPDKFFDWNKRKELYADRELLFVEIPVDDDLRCD